MPRGDKSGSIRELPDGRWLIRRRYTDLKGRACEKKSYRSTEKKAETAMRDFEKQIARELAGITTPTRAHTFDDLLRFYRKDELKPAEYVGETKVTGLRSWRKYENRLKPLEAFFGRMKLATIDYNDCLEFKRRRLRAPVVIRHADESVTTRPRSVASVNRELSLLRHLLYLAVRERWISAHPFQRGKPLIHTADEKSRMRILTWDEEARLLAACTGPRAHLRVALLTAIETGLRHNEQFSLERRDVHLDARLITVRAFNAKTAQTRDVPVFARLLRELGPWSEAAAIAWPSSAKVFPHGRPKRAFLTACRLAGLEGLRWHDLRHTAATRMLHFYKLSEAEVMKILGHTNYKTFLRYVNLEGEIVRSITQRVDAAQAEIFAGRAAAADTITAASTAIN